MSGSPFPTPEEYQEKTRVLIRKFTELLKEHPEARTAETGDDLRALGVRIDRQEGTRWQVRVALAIAKKPKIIPK